jgi:hypothetical protein
MTASKSQEIHFPRPSSARNRSTWPNMKQGWKTTKSQERRCGRRYSENHRQSLAISIGQLARRHHISQRTVISSCIPSAYSTFCEWLLQQKAASSTFVSRVLLMEEACFARNRILTISDNQTWADTNSHSFKKIQFRQQFALNIWVRIIGNLPLNPYELPPLLLGASCLQFISEYLPELLEHVPLEGRQTMWLQHNETPTHSRDFMRHSDSQYPCR